VEKKLVKSKKKPQPPKQEKEKNIVHTDISQNWGRYILFPCVDISPVEKKTNKHNIGYPLSFICFPPDPPSILYIREYEKLLQMAISSVF